MKWLLEVVVVPVSDVDRAKAFYAEQLGFDVDHDTTVMEGKRIVQLTPPGSGCSIVIGEGVVPDMPLRARSRACSSSCRTSGRRAPPGRARRGRQRAPGPGREPAPQPDELDNVGFVFFSDPDGNGWAVQQISARGQSPPPDSNR